METRTGVHMLKPDFAYHGWKYVSNFDFDVITFSASNADLIIMKEIMLPSLAKSPSMCRNFMLIALCVLNEKTKGSLACL